MTDVAQVRGIFAHDFADATFALKNASKAAGAAD
jgi:hypothetical protein